MGGFVQVSTATNSILFHIWLLSTSLDATLLPLPNQSSDLSLSGSMPRYLECVQGTWSKPVPGNQNHMQLFHTKLSRTVKVLWTWSKTLILQGKLAMVVAREVIQQLKKAQEHMQLIPQERVLIKHLKTRILGLAAIQKSRARQQSRLTWIRGCQYEILPYHDKCKKKEKTSFIPSNMTMA
jgi:hypothetical protein